MYIKNKFFTYENDDKCKLLNVGSGLFSTVSDVFAFYVGNPSLDVAINMDDFVRDLTTLWFCTIGMERVGGKLEMVYQPAKNYWNDGGIDKISRLYQDDNEDIYVFVQSYYVWYIENKLYKTLWYTLDNAKEVPLDTIPQTTGLQEIQQTGLEIPALIVVEDSEISIIEKIIPLVYAIDRQAVMNHTQYLQNLESFILFKNIKRPQKLIDEYERGKRIDFSQVGRILNGGDNSSVEFVNNVNDLIDKAIAESDNQIRRISALTTIPVEFLWLETGEGAIGLGSRMLRHWAFIKRIEYLRSLLDEAIAQYMELAGMDETYTRPDVFAKTDTELVEELKIAREAKLISLYEAIKKYNWYSDEETEEEVRKLGEETVALVPTQEINEETI